MAIKLKRYLVKFALLTLKGARLVKDGLVFIFKFLDKPMVVIGKIIYSALFFIYKIYFFIRRAALKIFPFKDIFGIITNKYIIHAAIVVIAAATVSQNIYAHTSSLGDYGKKSILFKLTKPTDDEETVQGLPINSDIEADIEGAASGVNAIDITQVEPYNSIGFIGGDYATGIDTANTRTSIEYYVVKKGDTPGSIAQEFGIGLETLLWANNLSSRSLIRPGDRLTILPVSGVAHTVKKGDTLAAIAKKYKADAEKIREFNHLSDDSLVVGQVVVVPDGKIIYVPPPPTYTSGYTASRSYESSGKLFWPVPSRRITQYYSWRHPGLDIGLPIGSEVVAADGGIVIYSGWGTGYGYEILIDHGNGVKTRYAHNSRLYVRKGDEVLRGQHIASSGNTGWSTGPHLHFEVYDGNVRRNPLVYIK